MCPHYSKETRGIEGEVSFIEKRLGFRYSGHEASISQIIFYLMAKCNTMLDLLENWYKYHCPDDTRLFFIINDNSGSVGPFFILLMEHIS